MIRSPRVRIESMPRVISVAANALTLVFGEDGHGRECNRWNVIDPDAAEQDVPDDPVFAFGHERSEDDIGRAQSIDQVGFIRAAERGLVDRSDRGSFRGVVSVLATHHHVLLRVHRK